MSNFDYEYFHGGYNCLGFNAGRYSKEEALEAGAKEYGCEVSDLTIEEAYVYYGFGANEEGGIRRGYWLCFEPKGHWAKAWSVRRVVNGV